MKNPNKNQITSANRNNDPISLSIHDERRSNSLLSAVAGVALCLSVTATTAQTPVTSSKIMFTDLQWTEDGTGAQRAKLWSHEDNSNGFLVRSNAGYTTGLVSRKNDYRAFVVSGQVSHKSLSKQTPSVLESGTFWVQPAGTEHELTCVNDCLFYVEPEGTWTIAGSETVPSNLQAIQISSENMPWVDAPNTGGTVKLAHVWGDPNDSEPSGFFLFFRAGFRGFPHVHSNNYDGVVLKGRPKHWEPDETGVEAAMAGSHLSQTGGAAHDDSCEAGEDCISYFRFHGKFDIFPPTKD